MEIIITIIIIIIAILIWTKYSNEERKKKRLNSRLMWIKKEYGERNIDKSLSLVERNKDIITRRKQLILNKPYDVPFDMLKNMIEDSVCTCIDDIAFAEGEYDMSHLPGENGYAYSQRTLGEYRNLHSILFNEFIESYRVQRNNNFIEFEKKHSDLIQKFFEITERKVSILDDYGEENFDELPRQLDTLISKIKEKEGHRHSTEIDQLRVKLEVDFKKYHSKQKRKNINTKKISFNEMSGVDFETFLSRKLIALGYKVSGTPTVGDQGADIIAKKDDKIFIIQAKRYSNTVGNKAIQEVVGALKYYNGNQACVITNSIFTRSAKALAQKNNVILIDGHDLKTLEKYF